MKSIKRVVQLMVGGIATVAGVAANAEVTGTTVDLTPITGAFTATDITTGVLAIAATLAVVYVTIKSAKIVLAMLKGG